MPRARIQNLMTELHEIFGNEDPSPEQVKLLESLEYHVHSVTDASPLEPTPVDTIEILVEQLKEAHPRTSGVLRELVDTLKNIGI